MSLHSNYIAKICSVILFRKLYPVLKDRLSLTTPGQLTSSVGFKIMTFSYSWCTRLASSLSQMAHRIVGKSALSKEGSLVYIVVVFFLIQKVSILMCNLIEKLYEQFDKTHKIGINQSLPQKVNRLLAYLKFLINQNDEDKVSITKISPKKNSQKSIFSMSDDSSASGSDKKQAPMAAQSLPDLSKALELQKSASAKSSTSSNLTYFHNNLKAKARCMSMSNLALNTSGEMQSPLVLQKQHSIELSNPAV